MNEYAKWKHEVTSKLAERGIPFSDESLVIAWNSNRSAAYTAIAQEAEWLCNQPPTKFNEAERCGCFRCCKFFTPDEIVWDDGIAECPWCGMDACLPESKNFPLTEALLHELSEKQFLRNPFI